MDREPDQILLTRGLPDAAPPAVCRMCEIASGRFARSYDQPLFETRDYFAIPSIGALTPGWVLIFAREHVLNLSQVYDDSQFNQFRTKVCTTLQRHFSAPIRMFEHGSNSKGSSIGCGVDHAHLHLVPLEFSIEHAVPVDADAEWTSAASTDISQLSSGKEYLFCSDSPEDGDPQGLLSLPSSAVSQYFRRLIAKKVGRQTEFDYRIHPQLPTVIRTAASLAAARLF